VKPVLISKQEARVLTDSTAKQILTLDETWAKLCNGGKLPLPTQHY
jgi:hypothetical protein